MGRLIIYNVEGNIAHDAQKIIYPGSDSDPWWDIRQLLTQVEKAISIFETAC